MPCANANTPARLLTQNAAEASVLCLINEERAANGSPPLTLNLRLRAAARQHANDARTLKWWAGNGPKVHVNPVTGSKPQDRIKDAGYCPEEPNCPMNENAYAAWYQGGPEFQTGTTPQAAVTWWMNSPGHRDTLLDPDYNETGVAVVLGVAETGTGADNADGGGIFVQTFGGCRKTDPATLGELWDWGRNDVGQLGDGSTTDRHVAVHPEGFADIVALAGGRGHSFALLGDGSVLAWGFNPLGQLGDGTTTNRLTPVQLSSLGQVIAVAAGNSHSLALQRDGTVLTWGANHVGQLGDGSTTDRAEPALVEKFGDVIAISAGFNFNLALKADGTVWSWGENNWGQLGDGTTTHSSIPVQVTNISGVAAISAGFEYGLALRADGSVLGWGSNNSGQLGDGSTTQRHAPVKVRIPDGSGPISAISAGGFHSMALEQNARVWTWGGNGYGQLGNGDTTDRLLPVRPVNMHDVTAIAAGFGHCLVLKRDATAWSWGMNNYGGQLGDGTIIDRSVQVLVKGLPGISIIAAGTFHSLAS
ncbi:alpha-tubulin suppressor-like RCC1 family protein [Aminobacter sp. AP02]|nr:alpha-tubulin suppressor-like RCC1 family protein [Aminobacter sp. AP02]